MNCIQPERARVGDVEVAAVVGLDLVDRGQDLPAHAVLHAGGLVDREQEGRDPELVDEEVRHADRSRPGGRERVGRVRGGGGAVGLVSFGASTSTLSCVDRRDRRPRSLQSRPEVEVEHFLILTIGVLGVRLLGRRLRGACPSPGRRSRPGAVARRGGAPWSRRARGGRAGRAGRGVRGRRRGRRRSAPAWASRPGPPWASRRGLGRRRPSPRARLSTGAGAVTVGVLVGRARRRRVLRGRDRAEDGGEHGRRGQRDGEDAAGHGSGVWRSGGGVLRVHV